MRSAYLDAVRVITDAFRRLEAQISPPIALPVENSFVYRYEERGIKQALIQKLTRIVSGLNAIDLLLFHGYVQEVGVLQRTLDEIDEDILFLALAITNDTLTDRHRQYLDAFYDDPMLRTGKPADRFRKPNLVPRKKIHSYVSRVLHKQQAAGNEAHEVICTMYSGYVHAASPHIMDLCVGEPPRFRLNGMLGTPRVGDHVKDAWNYFYRGLLSTCTVAKAFGDADLVEELYGYMTKFEHVTGHKGYERERSGT